LSAETGDRGDDATQSRDTDSDTQSRDARGAFHQWFGDGLYVLTASYGGLQGIQHGLLLVYKDDQDALLGENKLWLQQQQEKETGKEKRWNSRGQWFVINTCIMKLAPTIYCHFLSLKFAILANLTVVFSFHARLLNC
jgi:hypothetical protein